MLIEKLNGIIDIKYINENKFIVKTEDFYYLCYKDKIIYKDKNYIDCFNDYYFLVREVNDGNLKIFDFKAKLLIEGKSMINDLYENKISLIPEYGFKLKNYIINTNNKEVTINIFSNGLIEFLDKKGESYIYNNKTDQIEENVTDINVFNKDIYTYKNRNQSILSIKKEKFYFQNIKVLNKNYFVSLNKNKKELFKINKKTIDLLGIYEEVMDFNNIIVLKNKIETMILFKNKIYKIDFDNIIKCEILNKKYLYIIYNENSINKQKIIKISTLRKIKEI